MVFVALGHRGAIGFGDICRGGFTYQNDALSKLRTSFEPGFMIKKEMF